MRQIIAAAIVGSGELVATTSTGAVAGFTLLWLIIIGCMIKVYTQIEFGRFSIVTGRTAMQGLNEIPGPRVGPVNWLVWYWLIMFVFSLAQLGGIVGGVGQAMAMVAPITSDFNILLEDQQDVSNRFATAGEDKFAGTSWEHGPSGAPRLMPAHAVFECVPYAHYDGGDHVIFVGRVVHMHAEGEEAPLL